MGLAGLWWQLCGPMHLNAAVKVFGGCGHHQPWLHVKVIFDNVHGPRPTYHSIKNKTNSPKMKERHLESLST
jgi:hypothetical protein